MHYPRAGGDRAGRTLGLSFRIPRRARALSATRNEGPVNITPLDPSTDVVTLSGDVGAADLATLRTALVAAVDGVRPGGDLLVDAHGVTAFDDAALPAFVTARSRAKRNRMSIAALAEDGSALEAALRRSGHLSRITVHPDAAAARELLGRRRELARARLRTAPSAGDEDGVARGLGPRGTANPYRRTVV